MKNIFRSFDILGTRSFITYDKNSSFKSLLGGIVSIFVV